MKLEEIYESQLLSIESAMLSKYRENPSLQDADVERAYQSLANYFTRKKKGLPDIPVLLPPKAKSIFVEVLPISLVHCEGGYLQTDEGEEIEFEATVNPGIMVQLFNRLISSVRFWSKKEGKQGYVRFLDDVLSGRRGI